MPALFRLTVVVPQLPMPKGADMTFEIPKPHIPHIWNAERDFNNFSKAVTENQFALAKRLDQLIALQERQNELLQQLAQGQLPKG